MTGARLEVDLTEVELCAMVDQTVHTFPGLLARVERSGTGQVVVCDRMRAMQCISNLISNAAKYSPPESVIGVETSTVEGGRWAEVTVTDTGRGIVFDEIAKVFDRFYRVEDPMTMTTSGSGLGLCVSRELARAMNGDLTVTSTLGAGSRFTLRLPVSATPGKPGKPA